MQLASCLGLVPALDPGMVHDIAIVGAGPAGLTAAVYGASEGLMSVPIDSAESQLVYHYTQAPTALEHIFPTMKIRASPLRGNRPGIDV